jgi:hypothetical protein
MKWLFAGLLALAASSQAETFKGYQCTKDCSGHKAGYAWDMAMSGVRVPAQLGFQWASTAGRDAVIFKKGRA